jgi:hypothetical protein
MPIIPVRQSYSNTRDDTKHLRRIRAEKVEDLYVHRRVIGDGFDDHLWTVSSAAPDPTMDPAGHAAITLWCRDREAAINLAEMLCVVTDWTKLLTQEDTSRLRNDDPDRFGIIRSLIDAAR